MNGAPPLPASGQNSSLATTSLVLGILSLVTLLFCLGPIFAVPAVICGHVAQSRIRKSGGTGGHSAAVTGLITGYITIGISFLLIPLMMAIAVPNFVRARQAAQKNACLNNQRQIDEAKRQWALEDGKTADDTPGAEDLKTYLLNGFPVCPREGTYTIGTVGTPATCSIPEHRPE